MTEEQFKHLDRRLDGLEILLRSIPGAPPLVECTMLETGNRSYKCALHKEFPWPGHLCPAHQEAGYKLK